MYIWVDNRALYVCVPPKTETVHGELSFWLYCKRSDSKPNCPIGGIYTIEQELLRTTELCGQVPFHRNKSEPCSPVFFKNTIRIFISCLFIHSI